MKSFFFVPGSKIDKVNDVLALGVSEIIIDLEDAVKDSERVEIINHLINNFEEFKNFFLRVPLHNAQNSLDKKIFEDLKNIGYRNFVFPKIDSIEEFDVVMESVDSSINLKVILLVETPRLLLEAKDLLQKYDRDSFVGIGLGSHDFIDSVGGLHSLENLQYPRYKILYLARMANIFAIDIASMELLDKKKLELEILNGISMGYDAKFILHPWQLKILEKVPRYSAADLNWAKAVRMEFDKVGSGEEFNAVKIGNQIVERAHLQKAKEILEYFKK